MFKSKPTRNSIAVGLLVLFVFTAGAGSETTDVLSGRDLLMVVRESKGRGSKPAYEQREAESAAQAVSEISPKPAASDVMPQPIVKPQSDELLKMLPAESMFCVRVNNLEHALGMIDHFLTGVSPIGLSMMVRAKLTSMLGSPELNGVNMEGSFAIFGAASDPTPNIFMGVFLPVAEYKEFVSGNPNVGQPDEKGVSKITGPMPAALVTQVGDFALISSADNYDKLIATAESISTQTTGLASVLDAAEAGQATTEPIWAYGNIQRASEIFAPLVFGQLENMKKAMENMPGKQGPMGSPAEVINVYATLLETLMNETKSLSLTIGPEPSVCNLTVGVSAMPETEMADMLTAAASADQENNLLVYLKDGAIMNLGFKVNTPFWRQMNAKSMDFIATLAGESVTAEDTAKMNAYMEDMSNALGDDAVFSFSLDTRYKPPFAMKYILTVNDADKFNKVMEESMEIMNTSGIAEFYENLGMKLSFTMNRGVDSYRGVSIDSMKFVMKSTEPNSPQGQMINAIYDEGFNYRFGIVDGLCVMAIGGDVDSAIRELIDEVKADGSKQMGDEMKTALSLLPEASTADFVGTYNFIRTLNMIPAMAGAMMPVPMPQVDTASKSNIVIAGRAGDGKMTVNIALPKEHLVEIVTTFQKMQMQTQPAATAANLKQLVLALVMYADDYDGKLPADLQQLAPYLGPKSEAVLESPRKPKGFDGPGYIYVTGLKMGMPNSSKIVVVYENPAFCSKNIVVAFLDGHVEVIKPERFVELLEATYKLLGQQMPEIKFKVVQPCSL